MSGATSYTVLYSPEEGFPQDQTIRVDGITGTDYTPSVGLAPGRWYWTVRAVDTQARGGQYLKTVPFTIADVFAAEVDTSMNLSGEQVTGWKITSNADTSMHGTVWVFRDTERKTEGSSSIRTVYTVNSLIDRVTNPPVRNPGTGNVEMSWSGPRMDYTGISTFTFALYPQRFTDTGGNLISPAKFLHFRMEDAVSGVVADVPVDSSGTLPAETWSTVSIPLGDTPRSAVTKVAFYIKCGDPGLCWDQRMVFNVDNMTQAPPASTPTPLPCGITECFNQMPAWASTAGAGVGWSIAPAGQELYCLRAAFTGNQSMARGITLPVTPGQAYDISIAMRTGADYWTCYWMETLWRDGSHPVEDYLLGSPPGWNRIQKFDGYCGPATNFDPTWQLYHARNITPASDTITIALAAGGLNNTQSLELFWDSLNVIPAGATPSPTPSLTPLYPDMNSDGKVDERDLFEFSQGWQDQQETSFGQ